MVAIVTPMSQGVVDIERLRALVEWHIEAGTHAIVAAGTTGESGTLSHEEKLLVIKQVIEQANERIPVIAGTAANATREAIQLTREAMEMGAHAALIMTPAYIRPTQEGLIQHYSKIATEVHLPIILYNVPSRTACDMQPETVAELSKISNVIGIKEAFSEALRLQQLLALCDNRLDIYSGDDPSAAEWMLSGAKAVISVTANVAPKEMAKMADLANDGQVEACLAMNKKLSGLHDTLFLESNPIPAKWALYKMGKIDNDIRMPLTSLSEDKKVLLEQQLKQLNLI